jgi:hypothetical protein
MFDKETEIKKISEIAKKCGGKLINTNYKNNYDKMCFECFHGHVFKNSANAIKNGRWCPKCNSNNRTEEICRVYFEHIFKSKFLKKRPEWLIGKNGYRIELDGYSEDSMVAFEYNGQQHYKKTFWYNFDNAELERMRINEFIKIEKCKERGIILIIITYKTKICNLISEIKKQLSIFNYPNIDSLDWSEPSLKEIYTSEVYIQKLRKDLLLNGFNLINNDYFGEDYKYTAKCNICGFERKANPWSLRKNGCKRCSGTEKKTIEDCIKLASSHGGFCLSKVYVNNSEPLQWECKCGYIWFASYNSIQAGSWCPKDGEEIRKLSIKSSWENRKLIENIVKFENAKIIAFENGFKLLSENYISCDSPLVFLCKQGHKWCVGLRSFKKAIKQGRGCTQCGPNSIKDTSLFKKEIKCQKLKLIKNHLL